MVAQLLCLASLGLWEASHVSDFLPDPRRGAEVHLVTGLGCQEAVRIPNILAVLLGTVS